MLDVVALHHGTAGSEGRYGLLRQIFKHGRQIGQNERQIALHEDFGECSTVVTSFDERINVLPIVEADSSVAFQIRIVLVRFPCLVFFLLRIQYDIDQFLPLAIIGDPEHIADAQRRQINRNEGNCIFFVPLQGLLLVLLRA